MEEAVTETLIHVQEADQVMVRAAAEAAGKRDRCAEEGQSVDERGTFTPRRVQDIKERRKNGSGKTMRIARVFPSRNPFTPTDELAFIGEPPLPCFLPDVDEVHVSVTFTWDVKKGKRLAEQWARHYETVRLGGPAIGSGRSGEFVVGRYLKRGITITSRGCPNRCWFCFVPKREGGIRELLIRPGYIVEDDNLLACSKEHLVKVFDMLRKQKKGIIFAGGFDVFRVNEFVARLVRSITVDRIFFAYDRPAQLKPLRRAVRLLDLQRRNMRCYLLIGYKGDTLEKAERRLREAWDAGTMPFAMLYRDDKDLPPDKTWKRFQSDWDAPQKIGWKFPMEEWKRARNREPAAFI